MLPSFLELRSRFSAGLRFVAVVRAVAADRLAVAARAFLSIAARDVVLTSQDRAVVARTSRPRPSFVAVAYAGVRNALDLVLGDELSGLYPCRPPGHHFNTVVNDPFVRHSSIPCLKKARLGPSTYSPRAPTPAYREGCRVGTDSLAGRRRRVSRSPGAGDPSPDTGPRPGSQLEPHDAADIRRLDPGLKPQAHDDARLLDREAGKERRHLRRLERRAAEADVGDGQPARPQRCLGGPDRPLQCLPCEGRTSQRRSLTYNAAALLARACP